MVLVRLNSISNELSHVCRRQIHNYEFVVCHSISNQFCMLVGVYNWYNQYKYRITLVCKL